MSAAGDVRRLMDCKAAAEESMRLWSARAQEEMAAYVSTLPPVSDEQREALAAERLASKQRAEARERAAEYRLALLLAEVAPIFAKHGAVLRMCEEDHGDSGFGWIEIDGVPFPDILIDDEGNVTLGPV